MKANILAVIVVLFLLQSCAIPVSLTRQAKDMHAAQQSADELSIAKVQRNIKIGMSSSDVIEVLGSPNMVTTDDKRREAWVYDKVSTNIMRTTSWGHGVIILPDVENHSASKTQKTLTIIIKFDEQGVVRDYAYHQAKF
jgi:outer membrane protein assembly factor BamE (lipoprotein component of BamABCDE complex)